ncbi:MAG: recombinase RecT [Thermoguttaceae bacterium]
MPNNLPTVQEVGTPENLSAYFAAHQNEIVSSGLARLDRRKIADICVRYFAKSEQRAKFAQCTPESFLTALNDCIRYGLTPTPAMECGYFIPYVPKDRNGKQTGPGEVKFQISYRGILEIARRNGVTAKAWAVHEGDLFDWTAGENESIVHKPKLTAKRDPSTLLAVYVVAKYTVADREKVMYEVMSKAEVDAVRAKSPASGSGPWVTDYIEMAKKTVIRRASKNWPLTMEGNGSVDEDPAIEDAEFEVSGPAGEYAATGWESRQVDEYQKALALCHDTDGLANVSQAIKDDERLSETEKGLLRKAYAQRLGELRSAPR